METPYRVHVVNNHLAHFSWIWVLLNFLKQTTVSYKKTELETVYLIMYWTSLAILTVQAGSTLKFLKQKLVILKIINEQ